MKSEVNNPGMDFFLVFPISNLQTFHHFTEATGT